MGMLSGKQPVAKPRPAQATKGVPATKGQAPMGIAKNGNIGGALQATQGQRSFLGGMATPKPGTASQKSLLGA
jgi:hypothetical protein